MCVDFEIFNGLKISRIQCGEECQFESNLSTDSERGDGFVFFSVCKVVF